MGELDELRRERDRWAERVRHLEARADVAVARLRGQLTPLVVEVVDAQREWSAKTFGNGVRTAGVLAHIREELDEIAANPTDLEEWIDVIILAIDGAWRATGASSYAIAAALVKKQLKNRERQWPESSTIQDDLPINHVRAPRHG